MILKDVLSMDMREVNRLTDRGELARAVKVMADVANKRIARMEQAGVSDNSQAYRYVHKIHPGKFGVKGKDIGELKEEFDLLRGFLSPTRKSSSVRGMRALYKKTRERLDWNDATDEEVGRVFDILHKLQEDPSTAPYLNKEVGYDRYRGIETIIAQIVKRGKYEDVTGNIIRFGNDDEIFDFFRRSLGAFTPEELDEEGVVQKYAEISNELFGINTEPDWRNLF